MLDPRWIREHPEEVRRNLERRRARFDLDAYLALDRQRSETLQRVEALRAERKAGSKGRPTPEERDRLRAISARISDLEKALQETETGWKDLLEQIPNLTHPDVPEGGEEDYRVLQTIGRPTEFPFPPKDHVDLGEAADLLDFRHAANVAGSGFYYLKNGLVALDLALQQYAFRVVTGHGFIPMATPDLARQPILKGIGFNPKGPERQIYNVEESDLSLIATAEITLGGYHADEILAEAMLPKQYAGLSHCYRTEAGAYGRESRGLYRVHQFTKVEMFVFCRPEDSDAWHDRLRDIEIEIFQGLGIPFRVIDTASGDLGGPAYRKYDLEAWLPGRGKYGEITSTSNTTDYQSRRLNIRFRRENGKLEFVHTLNGTAIATSRALLAIMENYQLEDGSIRVPEVLVPLAGVEVIPGPEG
ncbi:MAG: serine--tRNA ligase [Armatimonadetes bacterium]|nr:serine--tRNA ligase [Armatimonadota bacterium]